MATLGGSWIRVKMSGRLVSIFAKKGESKQKTVRRYKRQGLRGRLLLGGNR